jgi:AcrR family transcriptional regulator
VTIVETESDSSDQSSAEARDGLRERKKAKTRRALEDAALALFAEHGFEGTTVEQIADACDVSPRTFFRYFATKEEALFGDSVEKVAGLLAVLESRPAGEPPLRSMRAAAMWMSENKALDRGRMVARTKIVADTPSLRVHGAERQDEWKSAAYDVLARRSGVAGNGAQELEIRVVVGAASAAMQAAVQIWLDDETTDLAALCDAAFDRLAAGFAA